MSDDDNGYWSEESSETTESEQDCSDLLAFARTYAEWRAKLAANDPQITDVFANNPSLGVLQKWLDGAEATHTINMQDKTASGLLRHLADAWGWTTDSTQISDAYWASSGVAGSSIATGQRVDTELRHAIAGTHVGTSLHRFTCRLLEYIREQNWILIAAQTPLWHRGNSIYTFIDLLAYDMTQKRVLVLEIKTGFDSNYDQPLSHHHLEFDVFVDTHRMRHQQQLCWMLVVLREELGAVDLDGCVLCVSDVAGVRDPEWRDENVEAYFRDNYVLKDRAYQQQPTPAVATSTTRKMVPAKRQRKQLKK